MRVNWRDMETEELGSVYEALLELTTPRDLEVRSFFFAEGAETAATRARLRAAIIRRIASSSCCSTERLNPLIERTVNENSGRAVRGSLDLAVHRSRLWFRPLSACRGTAPRHPGCPASQPRRSFCGRLAPCLYVKWPALFFGVDRNPMAVELCQTALWIESVDPGKPLTLLDAHIQCGDSLIGVWDLASLVEGIPDEAYKPLTGDNKEAAAAWRKLNKAERDRPPALPFSGPPPALVAAARAVDDLPEDEVNQVEAKASCLADFHRQTDWRSLKAACDLYVAGFFAPKIQPPDRYAGQAVPTTRPIWDALEGGASFAHATALAADISASIHAFHWPLAFPQIFAKGGFDVVLGNPPWDTDESRRQGVLLPVRRVKYNSCHLRTRNNGLSSLRHCPTRRRHGMPIVVIFTARPTS